MLPVGWHGAAACLALCAAAASPDVRRTEWEAINVLNFGAVGDGVHDDTDAIQRALVAAANRSVTFSCNTHLTTNNSSPDTGVCGMSRGTVVFPSGNYTISRTLTPGVLNIKNVTGEARTGHANAYDGYAWFLSADLRGEAGAGITQLNASLDIFYTPVVWRWKVSGLTLSGGRNHFLFGTDNLDNAFITITDCVFGAARGAVIATLPGNGQDPSRPMLWNTTHRPPGFPSSGGLYRGSFSTQLTVRDCQFFNNEQVLVWWGDTASFDDTWVEGHGVSAEPEGVFDYGGAIFENHGKLILNRMLGVPGVVVGSDQRWIDNWGYITARGCRFGGEGGGEQIVVQKTSFLCEKTTPTSACNETPSPRGPYPSASTPFSETSIRIYDCDIFSNNAFRKSAFYFEQIPSELVLHESIGLMEAPGDNPGTLIAVNPAIDLSEQGQLAFAAAHPGALAFDIRLNTWVDVLHRTNWSALPAAMLPLQSTPVYLPDAPIAGFWRPGQQVLAADPKCSASDKCVVGWTCVKAGWGRNASWAVMSGSLLKSDDDVAEVDSFAQLLRRLGLEQYKELMSEQEISNSNDLLLLSDDDMVALKLKIGSRNRLKGWQRQHQKASRNAVVSKSVQYTRTFDVMDFGAMPNGSCCSTAAINATIQASNEQSGDYGCGSGCATWGPAVLLPHGQYKINDTLPMPGLLRGDGNAFLHMLDPTKDIFFSISAWRIRIEGVRFFGGLNQLHLGTNDTDCSFWVVSHCVFSGARSSAIRVLGAQSASQFYIGSQSTQMTITASQFFNNEQVVVWHGDTLTVEDAWVEGSGYNASFNKSLFENHAKMILNRMLGVPSIGTGHQRWIDNYGELNAHNCRFGGENGGMTVAVNYASFVCYPCSPMTSGCGQCWASPPRGISPYNRTQTGMGPTFKGGGLRFSQCDFFSKASAGTDGFKAVIVLEEIPSYLVITDSMGFKECSICGLPGEALLRVNPQISLSSQGQLGVAALWPNTLQMHLARNSWVPLPGTPSGGANSSDPAGYAAIPLELLPYVTGSVVVDHPPNAGYWRVGQQVLAANVTAAGTIGWVCVQKGEPGMWRPISSEAVAVKSTLDNESFQ